MNTDAELAELANRLSVSWKKANNFFCSFATLFYQAKQEFELGRFKDEEPFPTWLATKTGLYEAQIVRMLKTFETSIAADEREKILAANAELDAQKKQTRLEELQRKKKLMEEQEKVKAEIQAKKDAEAALRRAAAIERQQQEQKEKERERSRQYRKQKKEEYAKVNPETDNLHHLVAQIKTALIEIKQSREMWIRGTMALARLLVQARKQFPSNNKFGDWRKKNSIGVSDDDMTALIGLGYETNLREILEQSDSISWQLIWRKVSKESTVVPMG